MSWGSSQLDVGDETLLYYGGYAKGHKTFTDRQIGIARFKRDRYVAQVADAATTVTTKPLDLSGVRALSLNAELPVTGSAEARVVRWRSLSTG
jgi:hypothetical protein